MEYVENLEKNRSSTVALIEDKSWINCECTHAQYIFSNCNPCEFLQFSSRKLLLLAAIHFHLISDATAS